MAYQIDLEQITIDEYKEKLKNKNLIPNRMILKENIEERFKYFKSLGIKNAAALLKILKNKNEYNKLIKVTCLSEDYLTILSRELRSILAKPFGLSDFKAVSVDVINKLEKHGLANTQQFYNKTMTKSDRQIIVKETDVDEKDILKLTKLSDLSRIQWVNSTFALLLYNCGYDTTEKVAKADAQELYNKCTQYNKQHNMFKGKIGLNDMKICVEAAKELEYEVEY